MRVAMIGAGYVGLVSGACFAEFGHQVTCVDNDERKVAVLNRGQIPIFEPDLDRLITSNVAAARLSFTCDLARAVNGADVVLIAVGTPSRRGDGHADLSYVYAAAREIAASLDGYTVEATELMEAGPIVGDRRWAIVDPMRQFVNGKRTAAVHPIRAAFEQDGAVVTLSREGLEEFRFALPEDASRAGEWLSEAIGRKCLLIENLAIGFPDDADAAGPTLVSTTSLERGFLAQ